jgi:hypothetical protein
VNRANLICLVVTTTNSLEVMAQASLVFSNLSEIGKFLKNEYSQTKGVGVWSFQTTIKEIYAS